MSRIDSNQLYRSTLGIYSNLLDDFSPSLQQLVSLGNSYVQAFWALAATSEAYFSALSKIGETAFHTVSSRALGDVLIQISESQRRLNLELDGVFRWFSSEVLQQMDSNVRLDKEFLSSSRNHYEMTVQNHAAALHRHGRRGGNQDSSEYVQFLRDSHGQVLEEEERRYRFLSEKHCGLVQSISRLMNKMGHSLQQRADAWTDEVNLTRQHEASPSSLDNTIGSKREEFRQSREEPLLGKVPSRAPSPQGSLFRFSADSAGGGSGGRSLRALVAHHPPASSPTLLPFSKGETITPLVQQPRNGWLYGRADSSSRQGWFPAAYVEPVDDPLKSNRSSFSDASLRSNSSYNNLFNQMDGRSQSGAGPPPPPPPPPPSSSSSSSSSSSALPSNKHSEIQAHSNSENKRSQPHDSPPLLFPRGTNPFATVKLKPTSTNDRSAPRLYR